MKKQKKYYYLEILFIFVIILSVLFSGLLLIPIIYSCDISDKLIFATGFFLVWLCYYMFFLFLKKKGFEEMLIPPNRYFTNMRLDELMNAIRKAYPEIVHVNEREAYVLTKQKGIKLRILLLQFDDFSKEQFKKRKECINRIINRRHNIVHWSRLTGVKPVRVNVVVTDKYTDDCYTLANRNASVNFARVEGVLNIFYSECERQVLIPAHFGISGFLEYNKTLKIMENVLLL